MKFAIIPLAFLVVCAWSMDRVASPVPDAPVPGKVRTLPADCLRGGDSTSTIPQGRSQTPSTWTPHQIDSLLKYLNIYTQYIGDTTGRYVQREVVERLLYNQHWRGRDSGFVFQGDDCIRIELRLGQTAAVPDTVLWINLCEPSPCFDSLVVPLGCWATTSQTVTDTQTIRICDTLCVQQTNIISRLYYDVWSGPGFAQLALQAGCQKTPPATSYFKFILWNARWYMLHDTTQWHDFGFATDSCYIDQFQVAAFIGLTMNPTLPFAGLGPWTVDSFKTATQQVTVDCGLYGTPGVTRITDNCRDTVKTITRTVTVETWTDAGRDTTIWTNLCDCNIPRFVCETRYDSVRKAKPIWEYIYTRDSVQCQKVYTDSIFSYLPSFPIPYYVKCADELDTTWTRLQTLRTNHGTTSRTNPNQRHVRQISTVPPCYSWSCLRYDDVPLIDPGWDEWWIGGDTLDAYFPCPPAECEKIFDYTIERTGVCCEKDTITTHVCYNEETGLPLDTIVVHRTVPDLTQPCNEWTYTDWTKTDSVLVDSLIWYEPAGPAVQYILTYVDTCCYTPRFNGSPFCDLWIILDCGPQMYKDSQGRWHIPCGVLDADGDGLLDGTDYAFITRNDLFLKHTADSLHYDIKHLVPQLFNASVPSELTINLDDTETHYPVTGWTVRVVSGDISYDSTTGVITLNRAGRWIVDVRASFQSDKNCVMHMHANDVTEGADTDMMWIEWEQSVTAVTTENASTAGSIVCDSGFSFRFKAHSTVANTVLTLKHLNILVTLNKSE